MFHANGLFENLVADAPGTAQSRPVRSGGPGRAGAAGVLPAGQADDQGVAALRAAPFPAVAVRYIRAARRLRVKLLEQPLLVASGAVPAQLRHPGDLLGAMRHGLAGGGRGWCRSWHALALIRGISDGVSPGDYRVAM